MSAARHIGWLALGGALGVAAAFGALVLMSSGLTWGFAALVIGPPTLVLVLINELAKEPGDAIRFGLIVGLVGYSLPTVGFLLMFVGLI